MHVVRGLRAGQVAAEGRASPSASAFATTSSVMPYDADPANPLFKRQPTKVSGRQGQHRAAHRHRLEPGRPGQVGRSAAGTACSTTGRCWEPSTTSSPTSNTRRRSRQASRRAARRPGPAARSVPDRAGAEDHAAWRDRRRRVRAIINALYPPGIHRAQHRHGDVGLDPIGSSRISTRSPSATSVKSSRACRCRPTTSGCAGSDHVLQPGPEHRAIASTTPATVRVGYRTGSVRRSDAKPCCRVRRSMPVRRFDCSRRGTDTATTTR